VLKVESSAAWSLLVLPCREGLMTVWAASGALARQATAKAAAVERDARRASETGEFMLQLRDLRMTLPD
jgi:hypothetical protein